MASIDGRRSADPCDDLLKQREAAIAAFDEKLEKLGYRANSVKAKEANHKKAARSGWRNRHEARREAKSEPR